MPGLNWYNEHILETMDLEKYSRIISKLIEDKFVYVFPADFYSYWVEAPLCEWLKENFTKLGFSDIVHEDDKLNYLILKEEMGFKLQPDFIVKKEGNWLRLEVECWSYNFNHNHDAEYCEIMLCYDYTGDIPANIEVITLREFLGYEYIICQGELFLFLDLYSPEFHKEYSSKSAGHLSERLHRWGP